MGTSLSSKEVFALIDRNTDAATRLTAHAHLTRAQIAHLYSTSIHVKELGLRRRLTGKRILQSGLLKFCRGVGETKLIRCFCKATLRNDKRALLKALLNCS